MKENYLGITIGPIYRTFSRARKTREFWAVSYSFSLLARFIMEELVRQAGVKDSDFALPAKLELDKAFSINDKIGIGLYPDRIICKFSKENWSGLTDITSTALQRLAAELKNVPGIELPLDELTSLLRSYYRISFVMKESEGNPILYLNKELDTLELYDDAPIEDTPEKTLTQFFESVNKRSPLETEASSFLKSHFSRKDSNGTIRIPSLIEIATEELARKDIGEYKKLVRKHLFEVGDEKDSDGEFTNALSNHWKAVEIEQPDKSYKVYHKYICVLKADGDKIGETLRRLNPGEEVAFSNKLINWGRLTLQELNRFGALPIYIGGDDLFCFAPVAVNQRDTIFHLILRLRKIFIDQNFPNNLARLSFGLSITYYKFPMAEAMECANDLITVAKQSGGDSVDIRLLKHSGSEFTCHLPLEDDQLLNKFLIPLCDDNINDQSFISSVMYQIRENESVYVQMLNNHDRIWNFVCNNFDDAMRLKKSPDKPNPKGVYLQKVSKLIADTFSRYGSSIDTEGNLLAIKEIYSILRLVRFIKGLEDADK